jgi:hypothetical protein
MALAASALALSGPSRAISEIEHRFVILPQISR